MKALSKGSGHSSTHLHRIQAKVWTRQLASSHIRILVPWLCARGESLYISSLSFFICKMVLPSPGIFKN